jgi:hypothetical protein
MVRNNPLSLWSFLRSAFKGLNNAFTFELNQLPARLRLQFCQAPRKNRADRFSFLGRRKRESYATVKKHEAIYF